MDKRKLEKEYQQGIELIQSYVTDYLVKNYAGIKKIEWQGIGVEYRNSPILGPSLFGNYVDTDVKVYVSDDNYFTMTYTLNYNTEYDDDTKMYIETSYLNVSNIDELLEIEISNHLYSNSGESTLKKLKLNQKEKSEIEEIKKSNIGNPNTKIIYNLKIHELKY